VEGIECDKIVIDDFDSACRVTQHLIDRGYKRIAFLTGPQNLQTYHLRKQGYMDALERNGFLYDESLVVVSQLTSEDGVSSVKQLSGFENPPDAYFCGNDITALSVMIYLLERGHRIPDDIGIVGFSNEPFSKVVAPSISTIVQPGFEMGQRAAELIIAKIENSERSFNTLTLPAELIIRGSSNRMN
jgi:LacI family transcriptional regulator